MDGQQMLAILHEGGYPAEDVAAFENEMRARLAEGDYKDEDINAFFGTVPVNDQPIRDNFREAMERAGLEPTEDLSLWEAFNSGYQMSTYGLWDREKMPDLHLPEHAAWYDRLAHMAGTLYGDFPAMVIGGAIATPAGGGAFSLPLAFGGAFALPAALRPVLMNQYQNGEISSFKEFWDVASVAFWEELKGFTTGYATGGVSSAIAAAGKPMAVKLAGEIGTMVSVGAGMEARVPGPQEFLDTALIILALKGATHYTAQAPKRIENKLVDIYVRTGKRPREVMQEIENDPSILEDLVSENIETPRAHRAAEATEAKKARVPTEKQKKKAKLDQEIEQARTPEEIVEHAEEVGYAFEVRTGKKTLEQLAADERASWEDAGMPDPAKLDLTKPGVEHPKNIYERSLGRQSSLKVYNRGEAEEVVSSIENSLDVMRDQRAVEEGLTPQEKTNLTRRIKSTEKLLGEVNERIGELEPKPAAKAKPKEAKPKKKAAPAKKKTEGRTEDEIFRDLWELEDRLEQLEAREAEPAEIAEVTTQIDALLREKKALGKKPEEVKPVEVEAPEVAEPSALTPGQLRLLEIQQKIETESPGGGERFVDFTEMAAKERRQMIAKAVTDERQVLLKEADSILKREKYQRGSVVFGTGDPPPKGPLAQAVDSVLARIADEPVWKRRYTLHEMYKDGWDRKHPMYRVWKAVKEGVEDTSILENFYQLERLRVGAVARATHWLDYGVTNFFTQKMAGPSLKKVLWPVRRELDNFKAFAISTRALELAGRDKPIETGIDLAQARKIVGNKKFKEKYGVVLEELVTYQSNLLQYLVDSGIVGEKTATLMREANQNYVPFYRWIEGTEKAGLGPGLTVRNPLFAIKGSELKLNDPIESVIKNTYAQIELAERNRVGVAFVETMEKVGKAGEEFAQREKVKYAPINVTTREQARIVKKFMKGETELSTKELEVAFDESFLIFRPGAQRLARNQIAIYRGGKREVWNVTPELYDAFVAGDAVQTHVLSKILQTPAKMLRAGSVLTPEFIARNFLRDQFSAYLFSDSGYIPFVTMMEGVYSLWRKDANFQAWFRSGGPMAELVSIDQVYLQRGVREMLEITNWHDTVHNVVRSPLEGLRMLSTMSEQATRVGEFKKARAKALKEGKTEAEALFEAGLASREITLDFGRAGAKGQVANRFIAFFNAQMQGVDKLVRTFREHPVRSTYRAMISVTLPSIILNLLNHDEEGWSEIPQWQKDFFWLIPISSPWDIPGLTIEKGGNVWFRFPKPFELGMLFGTVPERLMDLMWHEDPEAFTELTETVIRGSTPSFLPTALVPLAETMFNHNIFLDRPIIPRDREDMLPEFQYSPYTTEFTKAVGRTIADIPGLGRSKAASPAIIDNFIRAWTGGLGNHVLHLGDRALRRAGVLPDRVDTTLSLSDIPLIKAFFVRFPTAGAESIQRFHRMFEEEEQIVKTYEGLKRAGEIESALTFAAGQRGFMMSSPRSIRSTLADLSRVVRQIHYNQDLGREEKTRIIHNTYYQMIEVAKVGIEVMERVKDMRKEIREAGERTVPTRTTRRGYERTRGGLEISP